MALFKFQKFIEKYKLSADDKQTLKLFLAILIGMLLMFLIVLK